MHNNYFKKAFGKARLAENFKCPISIGMCNSRSTSFQFIRLFLATGP